MRMSTLLACMLLAAAPGVMAAEPAPVRVELVDDATLGSIQGRYAGANMLVGVRIDLVSTLSTAGGASATASGSLLVQRVGNGYRVRVDSQAQATAGTTPDAATGALATGGEGVSVNGIGQITQIAGDGNRASNLALIQLGAPQRGGSFNGRSSAQADAGGLVARVSFEGGGVNLGLNAPGVHLAQTAMPGSDGRLMQVARIAGDGFTASNTLQMQVMADTMPALSLQQLGIQQMLNAVGGLRR